MKRAKGLWPQVRSFEGLRAAAKRASRGKALTMHAAAFLVDLEPSVLELQRELDEGSYRPRPYRSFRIVDPKPRTISAAAFRDRVVHHSLCAAMEPVLERRAMPNSYACRVGKGSHAALAQVQRLTRRHTWYVKLDIEHFFETASHRVLKALLRRQFADGALLALCDHFIDAGAPGSPPGRGLPIGNLTSQHFANAYLTPLDRFIKQDLRVPGYVRYMDDEVLLGESKAQVTAWRGGGLRTRHAASQATRQRRAQSADACGPALLGLSGVAPPHQARWRAGAAGATQSAVSLSTR